MPLFFSDEQYVVIEAACARLIPSSGEASVADYIDGLLGAFGVDPPRIWAGGPFSGRHGGEARFDAFIPLSPLDELAWRTRIDSARCSILRGMRMIRIVAVLCTVVVAWPGGALPAEAADGTVYFAEGTTRAGFTELLYEHACEGMYGAPEYGGNRDLAGWRSIEFEGDVQPRGYTDDEVSLP